VKHTQRVLTGLAACLFVVFGGVGCELFEGEYVPPTKLYGLSQPKYAVAMAEQGFDERDATHLNKALADNFIFYFDPNDVGQEAPGGGGYVIPESWDRAAFLSASRNAMEQAYKITLAVSWDWIGTPETGATEFYVENIQVDFILKTDKHTDYIVKGGLFDFAFEKDDNNTWHLSGWWDRTSSEAEGTYTAFGTSLCIYR
jgi:hypothetical protein